jgi:hypothetical protein
VKVCLLFGDKILISGEFGCKRVIVIWFFFDSDLFFNILDGFYFIIEVLIEFFG